MKYEVHIQRGYYADIIEFFLIERTDDKKSFFIEALSDGVMRRAIVEEGGKVNPFMTFRGHDTELIRAFSDEINRFLGKPDETFTRGKLEATERHLQDMRDLALKSRKS